jgi:hypothetical protein
MLCQSCGTEFLTVAKFCGHCGTRVPNATPTTFDPSAKNYLVRTLFVLGVNQSRQAHEWLANKYPAARVEKFSTIGAVRETAARLARSGVIESICLIGTASTVPPDFLFDSHFEARAASDAVSEYRVESDFLYGTQAFSIDALPSPSDSAQSQLQRQLLRKIGIDQLADMIPVARIPFDDPKDWVAYLESLDSGLSEGPVEWVALTANEEDWKWECEVIFDWLNVHADLYEVPPDDEYESFLHFMENRAAGHTPTRILINGHGGLPMAGYQQCFDFYADDDEDGGSSQFTNDLSDLTHCEGAALFLFACHGGDSGWWDTGLLSHFLSHGGRAVVAASSNVYCTQPGFSENGEVPPGALQVCAEFWAGIDRGLPAGAALVYAKQKALADAFDRHPAFFARCLKEVLHFSLYGAPWAPLASQAKTPSLAGAQASVAAKQQGASLLDKVRAGVVRKPVSSSRVSVLSDVRQRLRQSLGEGAAFFTLDKEQTQRTYRQSGAWAGLESVAMQSGLDFSTASFQSLQVANGHYHLAEIPTVKGKKAGALLVMDDRGSLLQKYHLKESK